MRVLLPAFSVISLKEAANSSTSSPLEISVLSVTWPSGKLTVRRNFSLAKGNYNLSGKIGEEKEASKESENNQPNAEGRTINRRFFRRSSSCREELGQRHNTWCQFSWPQVKRKTDRKYARLPLYFI